jgi:carbon storage regulator CsrA
MLVITRFEDDSLRIACPDGTEIEVLVVNIKGNKVRLGIEAPQEYRIHRGEAERVADEIARPIARREEGAA